MDAERGATVYPAGGTRIEVDLPEEVGPLGAREHLPSDVPVGSRATVWAPDVRDRLRFDGSQWTLVGSESG